MATDKTIGVETIKEYLATQFDDDLAMQYVNEQSEARDD